MYKGNVKSNSIWQMLILFLILSWQANLDADCTAWKIGPAPSGGRINSPPAGGVYLCGSKVTFTCSRATDTDYYQHENDGWVLSHDTMNSNWPRWDCSKGNWLDGDKRGTTVYWLAPEFASDGIQIDMYEDDIPDAVDDSDGCSDSAKGDDPETLQDTKIIKAIVPVLDEVTYGVKDTGAKISCDEPEWKRDPAKNVEVYWTKLSNATAKPKFWYSENLTIAPGNVVVSGDTSNDDDNIGDWLESTASWGTTWPQPGTLVCESGKDMKDELQTCNYETQWSYRCPDGTNNSIDIIPKQTDLVFHVVDPVVPGCTVADFFEDTSQNYGFDNYTSNGPYKSVRASSSDTAKSKIYPCDKANEVYYVSSNTGMVTVSPTNANVSPQTVTVAGVSSGNADIDAKLTSVSGPPACGDSTMKVSVYVERTWTLGVRVVNEENDDVQVIQPGNGKANTDAVNTGSNGICNTTASGDDVQLISVGNGQANQTAITAGSNGILDTTPSVDDTIAALTITTGANGVCNTIAQGDDVQIIPVNNGKPNVICIDTGANGICNTSPSGDDVPMIPLNEGKPNEICVSVGTNAFRDTPMGGDDQFSGDNITTGADGICNTTANNTDVPSTDPFDSTASDLQIYLNNTVYNQAIVHWTVTKLSPMTVNFDLNRDGFIDVSSWMTVEMQVIRDQCDDAGFDKVIFIVNNPSDGSAGFMRFNQKWGFIHPGTGCPNMLQVTSHELGHSLGLHHTDDDGISGNDNDIDNLMYNYCNGGGAWNKLRCNQWLLLH